MPDRPPRYWDPRAYDRDYFAAEERGYGTRGMSVVGEYYGSENRPERRYKVLDMRGDVHTGDVRDNAIRSAPNFVSYRGRGPRTYRRSDQRILEDVCERLSNDAWVDATDIEVKVEAAEVQLSGTVEDRGAKRRAELLAEQVVGVRDVQNAIRVVPQRANR
jgi:BON domain